ncbi:MAG: DUF5060 domain-containing protein [Planctomycetota bacterium]
MFRSPGPILAVLAVSALGVMDSQDLSGNQPIVDASVVFSEQDGLVAVEAEHFFRQTKDETRKFYLTHSESSQAPKPDGDPSHVAGASGGAYLEILPDTRRTHGDKLTRGVNFAPEPGQMAVLSYRVHFSTPGKYYVWVRAYSTGSEDNGLHVGLNGQWPESGQRMQWCQGKRTWRWESKQRTAAEHCGVPHEIYLEIPEAGEHTIHFSMREDGFEFDKWLMTTDREFARPDGVGPKSNIKSGSRPKAFALVQAKKATPTVAKAAPAAPSQLQMPATMFAGGKLNGYYLDKGKWLAINPNKNKKGSAERTFPYPTGKYHVTLLTVGENDGQSSYDVSVDGEAIGSYTNPLGTQMFEEGRRFHKQWKGVSITEGAIIRVGSEIGSADGREYSRARWTAIAFQAADAQTRSVVQPYLKEQAAQDANPSKQIARTSPTKPSSDQPLQMPRGDDGDGSTVVRGETKQWHKVTIDLRGPYAHEKDNQPNPFTDYNMFVTFVHRDGTQYRVPGYFAADGDAANTSAEAGHVWRAHFAPDKTGDWTYRVSFSQGKGAALNRQAASETLAPFDGASGSFRVAASDKQSPDLRSKGRLQYVGNRYLRFAGSGEYFMKAGADAPETLLAYADFDNTLAGNPKKAPIKTWGPHVKDWNSGDPTWGNGKGKGLIGAVNYLSGKGCNAFSFLTYNAGGDGDNVWPFVQREDKLHYDCSKLDQWGTVFDHGTSRGMYLHFKMQETENDDHIRGKGAGFVAECLDGGNLGDQRKLYCREMVARFGHNLALNWNLGEENTQSTQQQKAMIDYLAELDAYGHNIVVHTFPNQQDQVYRPLLGDQSKLTGVSLQNSSLRTTHAQTLKWVNASTEAGKPWVVAFDESGSAKHAQCPDLGYNGFDGHDRNGEMAHTQHEVRKQTLWGTLMAGGTGCEYYFGYQFDENDIVCEDWRSRDQSWDYCRIALNFFRDNDVPFWEMKNADGLVGNMDHDISKYCFAKANQLYLVYLPDGGTTSLDLSAADGKYDVKWFNPRSGGALQTGTIESVAGGDSVAIGQPPADQGQDWLAVIRRR